MQAEVRDTSLIPGSERSPGLGKGNPLQFSCLENPTDKRTWHAAVHRVLKTGTQLKPLSMHNTLAESRVGVSVMMFYCLSWRLL